MEDSYLVQNSLTLDIYVIGYKSQGESIVIIVRYDGNIAFSCVVDCFEESSINKTVDILKENHVQYLDLICWTHPDEDHSIGIDTLLGLYQNKGTVVLLPANINGEEYEYNDRIRKTFDSINKKIEEGNIFDYCVKSVCDNQRLIYSQFKTAIQEHTFCIKSMAPNSSLLRRRDLFTSKPKKNDYSIGLTLELGSLQMLLGGDVEKKTIEQMENWYIPKSMDFIKVPHHTSKTSTALLKRLQGDKAKVACSTVYRGHSLPDLELVELYKSHTLDFYCTGRINKVDDSDDFGIIHIQYDILNEESETRLYGNAECYFNEDS